MKIKNKVAIITGAGSGIGREIALKLAREKINIVIVYKNNDANAEESSRMIRDIGVKAIVFKVDASDTNGIKKMVNEVHKYFERIDILVNNAGVFLPSPLIEMSEETWDQSLDVDLKASFICTQAVARYWKKTKNSGRVVNIGSVHGKRSWQGLTAYASAKTGLIGLTRVMALELAPYNINVNLVSPGAISTGGNAEKSIDPQFASKIKKHIPLGRMGTGEEVANLVFFLVSKESGYITGADFVIDGGLLLSPLGI